MKAPAETKTHRTERQQKPKGKVTKSILYKKLYSAIYKQKRKFSQQIRDTKKWTGRKKSTVERKWGNQTAIKIRNKIFFKSYGQLIVT